MNVTLQDSKYRGIIKSLNVKLEEYDRQLSMLKPIEKLLLKTHIEDLNAAIKTGFYPLNWTSQRIPAYIEDLDKALVLFQSIVSQVHKNAAAIQEVVTKISTAQLLQEKDFYRNGSLQTLDISEFYEIVETRRVARLDALAHDYKSIGESFLMKVEEIIAQTTTGCSTALAAYYHYWERIIYNAITQMVIRSMAALMGFLQCKDALPLFKVVVSLNGKEFVVSPSLTEVDKILTKSVKNMAESARSFVRWMHGTCETIYLKIDWR